MYQTIVKRVSLPVGRRILAVSDIHAGRAQLEQVLNKAAFSSDDILFIVGDYIERGTESLGVLRDVMALAKRPNVYPMMGNVDLSRLHWIEQGDEKSCAAFWEVSQGLRDYYGQSLLWEMCGEAGLSPSSPQALMDCMPQLRERFKPELDFLRSLPTIIETERYIFVHGGIPSETVADFAGSDAFPYLKNDAFVQKGLCFDRWVVVGHWPAMLYREDRFDCNPFVSERQHILAIDGGCGVKKEGQLNLTVLPEAGGRPLEIFRADGLETVSAMDAQPPSESGPLVTWMTRQVEVFQRGQEFSLVRHLHSGWKLRVPSCYLYQEAAGICCNDYSDYQLPVSPGDTLSVILETSEGLIAKKDGVVGWYRGRWR